MPVEEPVICKNCKAHGMDHNAIVEVPGVGWFHKNNMDRICPIVYRAEPLVE